MENFKNAFRTSAFHSSFSTMFSYFFNSFSHSTQHIPSHSNRALSPSLSLLQLLLTERQNKRQKAKLIYGIKNAYFLAVRCQFLSFANCKRRAPESVHTLPLSQCGCVWVCKCVCKCVRELLYFLLLRVKFIRVVELKLDSTGTKRH